jgi:glycosyltransferase involved in cell wall biosynthesis
LRVVIDLQGAQSASRTRGIGRYGLALSQAMARNRGEHDILIALSDAFPQTIAPIRRAFRDSLPLENIRVWEAPGPVRFVHNTNRIKRRLAELIYEAFLASLEPDVLHVMSLFEGYGDDAVTSIGMLGLGIPTAVTLYDLIPLHNPDRLLANPEAEEWYGQKIEYLKKADLLLAISDFTSRDARERLHLVDEKIVNISSACSEHFRRQKISATEKSALCSRLGIHRPFILTAGTIEPHKNLSSLFRAFALLPKTLRSAHCLVIIGKHEKKQLVVLNEMARGARLEPEELVIPGYLQDADLVKLYNLCSLMVVPSIDEGFGLPALEAMACGTPTIGAQAAGLREVIANDEAMFDGIDIESMSDLIEKALTDHQFRKRLRAQGLSQAKQFSWDRTAQAALEAMTALHAKRRVTHRAPENVLSTCLDALKAIPTNESQIPAIAQTLARNFPARNRSRQLFIDISELAKRDARTGCQRVTRSVLFELLKTPPTGFKVEPVYAATTASGYRYARAFSAKLSNVTVSAEDAPIDFGLGDVFFGLDFQADSVASQKQFLGMMKRHGIKVAFLVHDILPVSMPHYFRPGMGEAFRNWLTNIAMFDGAICVSEATAESLRAWYRKYLPDLDPDFQIDWVHNGADIENPTSTFGIPEDAADVLAKLDQCTTFLMVGTIEPRKGYRQVLAAFECLWARETDINLVIVGKEGWDVDYLTEKLRTHDQRGHHLFWLEGISDEYLEKVYANSDCLIAASEGEGFGLPLVEAARHKLPILARDIPVFREVAGRHATYFNGLTPQALVSAIESWLTAFAQGKHIRPDGLRWTTWSESAQQMMEILLPISNNRDTHENLTQRLRAVPH